MATRLRSLKALKTEAWTCIARFVRKRDQRCVTCEDGLAEHCGHYRHNTERNASLGGNALWYDLRNLNGQCAGCNTFRAGRPQEYALFLEKKYGKSILQELNKLWLTPKKWSRIEIEQIIEKYKI